MATPRRGKRRRIVEDLDHLIAGSTCQHEDNRRIDLSLAEDVLQPHHAVEEDLNVPTPTRTTTVPCTTEGLVILAQLVNYIPEGFLHHRYIYIANILSTLLKTNVTVADTKAWMQIDSVSNSTLAKELPPLSLLWETTFMQHFPHTLFLAPPTTICVECSTPLQVHNKPTSVICYTLKGPLPAAKLTLRCPCCRLNYRYDQYGSSSTGGYQYYATKRPFVRATNSSFVSNETCSLWAAAGHHAWTSFQASAEIYNEFLRSSQSVNACNTNKFLVQCQSMEMEESNDEEDGSADSLPECTSRAEIHRKVVAHAFWNSELEEELRERKWLHVQFSSSGSREDIMEAVDKERSSSVYEHKVCSDECKKRGCGRLFSIDGNWKLTYPICMYRVPKEVSGFHGHLKYVDSCPNSPKVGMAFCDEHCHAAKEKGWPTELRAFLHHVKKFTSDSLQSTGPQQQAALMRNCTNALDCQGTYELLRKYPDLRSPIDDGQEDETTKTVCNKETGEQKKMQKWTRGVWMAVSGGGIIQSWQPLYNSEGPAQVFLVTLNWLVAALGHMNRPERQKTIVSYDNMCHLDNLKVAKKPLPLPGNLKHIWSDVTKIIDTLHISNHKDPKCKQIYHPDQVKKDDLSTFNTMTCEQTFSWLSRFKKILSAMQKIHFHFYLHRLVKKRNSYVEYCYKNNRRPLLPKAK